MHGFEAIDAAKEEVEKACPGVVSCADVLQFAVRDVVILTGGCDWRVLAGRRDGLVSNSTEVPKNILAPDKKVSDLLQAFQKKGFNAAQMVTLTGAHTIGRASWFAFDVRIHNFSGDQSKVDPSLPPLFASILKKKCPSANLTKWVNLEVITPRRFDTQYYKNLIHKIGLLTSDMSMVADSHTQEQVYMNTNWQKFSSNFADAMVDLSKLDVLTVQSGEIRLKCRFVN
ncbi:peroxidase 5 [Physcomitrium patens]|nr:peroxidase 5-like [Physcomitrium patens]|eukprot:XP_024397827.1 peroxidase 5-like [Physcomitrella patens]